MQEPGWAEARVRDLCSGWQSGKAPAVGFPPAVGWRPIWDEFGDGVGWRGQGVDSGRPDAGAPDDLDVREGAGRAEKRAAGASCGQPPWGFLRTLSDLGGYSQEDPKGTFNTHIEKSSWLCRLEGRGGVQLCLVVLERPAGVCGVRMWTRN